MADTTSIGSSDELPTVNKSPELKELPEKQFEELNEGPADVRESTPNSSPDGKETDETGSAMETDPAVVGKLNILQRRDRAVIEDGKLD